MTGTAQKNVRTTKAKDSVNISLSSHLSAKRHVEPVQVIKSRH